MKTWVKAVLPLAVVLAGMTATLVVHGMEQPDPADPSYLSPVSSEPDGAADLARRLTESGIVVDRRTRTPEAIAAVTAAAGSTLFVPAPSMVHPRYRRDLRIVPPSVRVVLVTPGADALRDAGVRMDVFGPRWTAAAPHSGCSEPFAAQPAAVRRYWYGADGTDFYCYDGGVVEVESSGPQMTLVGAPDAFRNDRQHEWGNADFATRLLSRGSRVVWLDLHERERPPPPDPFPGFGPTDVPRPDDEGEEYEDFDPDSAGEDGEDPRFEDREGRPEESSADAPDPPNPLFEAFPPAFWATVLLLVLAVIALALAAGRRLGAPVPEPLPAPVRAAETVRGLGGLYRRARARDESLRTLQDAARQRLAAHYDVPPEDVDDRVPMELRAALMAVTDGTDEDLAVRAETLQRLVRQVIEGEQK